MKDYNFRVFITSSDKTVLGGKSSENNEELIKQVKPAEIVLHTAEPGSPFVNIKGKASKKDLKESAIFCAKYSQDWRDNKKDILIHVFKGADIYKNKKMKQGTFGVKKFEIIKIKKEDILNFEKKLKDEIN
jgi:predicted ribosome quality control (RQC) complex YloA/Tae2 family protein